eukprot:5710920-Pyramimonas_sp.AAC.1
MNVSTHVCNTPRSSIACLFGFLVEDVVCASCGIDIFAITRSWSAPLPGGFVMARSVDAPQLRK